MPIAVFSNEDHDDGVTRYLSACWLDSLSEIIGFGAVAAEAFHFEHPVRPWTADVNQINGFYVHDRHFGDIIHAGGQNEPYLLGYDFSRTEPEASNAELEALRLAPNRWNRRDRSGAIRLHASIQRLNIQNSVFVHVGPGHSQRESIQRANGREQAMAGHFQDLLGTPDDPWHRVGRGSASDRTPVISIDNAIAEISDFRREHLYPCGNTVDFDIESIIVEYQADRIHCIRKADFLSHDRFHDVTVVDRPAAAANGFVTGLQTICGHRRAVEIEIPEGLPLQAGQSLRLSILQRDGVGRFVPSWVSPHFQPGERAITAYPFNSSDARLIWEAVPGRQGNARLVEDVRIDSARLSR